MRPSHNSAQLNYLLCWPFQYRRSFQSSWYPCIYWYLYIQKMTDEEWRYSILQETTREKALHLHWLSHGWWSHWVQVANCTSQVTLRNLISTLTRNRKFILCGRTSNIICKFPHKYHQAQNVTKFNKCSFSNRYLTHMVANGQLQEVQIPVVQFVQLDKNSWL